MVFGSKTLDRRLCNLAQLRDQVTQLKMNHTTALTHALVLALLAPDQARADKAVALAESIASGCTAKKIAAAKCNAAKFAK
jgi:hypothetical protein